MTRQTVIAAAIFLFVASISAQDAIEGYREYTDSRYGYTITYNAVKNTPSWKSNADNPPLSARKAIQLATAFKDTIEKDTKDYKWVLQSASLTATDDRFEDKWYWVVQYMVYFTKGGSTGEPIELKLAVLMDGTVIKPDKNNNQ